ncbi:MAG: long-chain fatty acid--CoA ligase [Chloroflexi bacterium]|nr:long-chain fatty acid--CoA ligase [Chloroflexota bacterium]
MTKPWHNSYDEGVPYTLAPYPDQTVHEILEETASKHPQLPACVTAPRELPVIGRPSVSITYRQLNDLADRFAAGLAAMGVQKGDRVALMYPNSTQFVIAFFGILKAGATVVAINPTYPAPQIAQQVTDSGARVAFCMSALYDRMVTVRNDASTPLERIIVSNVKEYFPGLIKTLFTLATERKDGHRIEQLDSPEDVWLQDMLSTYSASQRPSLTFTPAEDVAIFQYTGGTTGVPKGARATHKGLSTNAMQMEAWLRSANTASSSPSFLAAAPFYHVYGLVAVLIFAVKTAAPMYMVPDPRQTSEVLGMIDYFKPTIYMGVPALYNAINQHPDVKAGKYDLTSIDACVSGSAPLPADVKRRFEELTSGKLMEGFGMSETAVASHCNPVNGTNKEGSIGLPLPDVDSKIMSLEDGVTELPPGEIGELVIITPSMMLGYHNMPTETANALRNGMLYTGDIAYMDEEGYFFIVDRKKDMVLIGGYNVYPNNIDKVLFGHPKIIEAAVAGIPHPEKAGQEALKAWIVVEPGETLTAEEVIAFCEEQLAPYAVPRRIEFVSELPKSTVGKILRRELIKQETEQAQIPAV